MELEATLTCKGSKSLLDALKKSLQEQSQERFTSNIELEDGSLKITVKAKDAVAMRASLNTYLRILKAVEEVE